MSRIVALGEALRAEVFALAGVSVVAAEGDAAVRSAWDALPEDAVVIILTHRAADALPEIVAASTAPSRLTVVMPG